MSKKEWKSYRQKRVRITSTCSSVFHQSIVYNICKATKVETIKAAEAVSGISGSSDNPAPDESETPDNAGTVQGERHSGFSWRAAVIIAVVLAGGAAAAAAIPGVC